MSIQQLTPYLSFPSCHDAAAFYEKAFGARWVEAPLIGPRNSVVHGEIRVGEQVFMCSDENPQFGNQAPSTLGGSPVRFSLVVDDVDAVVARAVEAGAEVVIPVEVRFYGHRSGRIRDPFGYEWIIATVVEEVSRAEMQRRAEELFGS